MASFDWNEIIVTNDGNVANEQVKERIILVTGEKGDNGKDGRGILQIRKTGTSGKYVTFTIDYDDGTKSNFTLELPSGQGGSMDTSIIAREFSVNETYGVHDFVIHEGKLYEFTELHEIGAWDDTQVTERIIGDVLDWYANKLDATPYITTLAPYFTERQSYNRGDYVTFEGHYYKFTENHPAGAWNDSHVIEITVTDDVTERFLYYIGWLAWIFDYNTNGYYKRGDYAWKRNEYDGRYMLYRFTADHHGAWDYDDVTSVDFSSDMLRLFGTIDDEIGIEDFDITQNYVIGDLVKYEDALYKFTWDHPAGEFDNRHVMPVTILDLINGYLRSDIIASDFNTHTNYSVGDYVMYDGNLYRFTTDHTAGAWIGTDAVATILADYFVDNRRFNEWIASKANSTSLADEFSESDTYAIGDYVMRNGTLYRTSTAHTGAWNDNDFYAVEVTDEFIDQSKLNTLIAGKTDLGVIAPDFSESSSYIAGERVIYNGKLYQFTNSHSGAWNQSDALEVKIINLINNNESKANQKASYWAVADAFNTLYSYSAGDYVYYGDDLYKFTTNHQGNWDSSHATKVALANDVQTINRTLKWKAPLSVIASDFTANNVYLVGDYVIYDGNLYRFTSTHTGAWDSTHVTQVALADDVRSIDLDKTSLSNVADEFSTSEAYTAGDCVIRNGNLYRFTVDHTAGAWNANQVEQVNLIEVINENGKAVWGKISGDITNQTDLMELLEVTVDKTVYVSASTGSDTNDGTQEHPFATLAKAVDTIPESGKGTIYIGTGTYNEDLSITGKTVEIQKYNVVSPYAITINGMSILNSDVTFDGSISIDLLQQATVENSTLTAGSNVYFESGTSETAIAERFVVKNSKFVFKGLITTYGVNSSTMGIHFFPNHEMDAEWGYVAFRVYNSYIYVKTLQTSAKHPILVQDGYVFCYEEYICTYDIQRQILNSKYTATGGRIYTNVGIDFGTLASKNDIVAGDTVLYGRNCTGWQTLTDSFYTESEVNSLLTDKVNYDDLETELAKKEDIIINDATGSPATLESEIAVNLTKCIADINFTQDTGGYNPSVQNLLVPFTNQTQENGTLTVDADGNCTVNKPEKSTVVYFTYQNTITLQPNTLYRLSFNNKVGKNYICLYLTEYADPGASGSPICDVYGSSPNMSKTFSLSGTVTTAKTVYLHITVRTNTFTNYKFSPMLECVQLSQNLLPNFQTETVSGTQLTVSNNGICTLQGTSTDVANFTAKSIELDPGKYEIHFDRDASDNRSVMRFEVSLSSTFDTTVKTISYPYTIDTLTVNSKSTYYFRIVKVDGAHVQTAFTFTPTIKLIREHSSYSPYNHICPITGRTGMNLTANGTVQAISWQSQAGTVYKGSLDVLTGKLTVTHGVIASYNGQTLTGIWYSDRDVYAEGFVPTTGAQVVYQLVTPLTYQLTPTEIQTIVGSNSFSADSGEVFVQYFTDQKLQSYIDEHDAQKQDLLTFDSTPTADSGNPVTSDGIKTALDDKADVITNIASGDIATFSDGVDAPVVDLTVGIEPVQDLHGYDTPWPAGGGKNKLPVDYSLVNRNGVNYTINTDGTFTLSGSTTSAPYYAYIRDINKQFSVVSGKTYTVSIWKNGNLYIPETNVIVRVVGYNGTTVVFSQSIGTGYYTFTVDNTYTGIGIYISSETTGVNFNGTYGCMVEESSTPSSNYEPYSNICPISGFTEANIVRTGKNFLETKPRVRTYESMTVTVNNNGSITLNGTTGTVDYIYCYNLADANAINTRQTDNKKHIPNGTYVKATSADWVIQIYGSNIDNANQPNSVQIAGMSASFTIDDTYKYNWCRFLLRPNRTFNNVTIYPYIYKSDETDLTWEPFGNTYSVSFYSAGTVYKGSLDVNTGKLTVTHTKYEAQNLESILNRIWYKSSSALNGFYINGANIIKNNTEFLCSHFDYTNSLDVYVSTYGVCYHDNAICFSCDPTICGTTLESWKAWLTAQKSAGTPVEVLIEFATPLTYQLTPQQVTTLLGKNNIWADTGNTDVTYFLEGGKDIGTAIDNTIKTAKYDDDKTRTMITQSSESAMVASKNYAVGDLMIINNQLLRATANIATNGAITIGTNAEVVDLDTVISEKVSTSYLNNLISANQYFKIVARDGGINTSETFTVGTAARVVVFVLDSSSQNIGAYIIVSTGNGNVNNVPILSASNVSLTSPSNGKVTITKVNNTNYKFGYIALIYGGQFTLDS